jgi:hypothetical protein
MATEKRPDGLPVVHDEAGNTPLWVPVLGGILLCLSVLYATLGGAASADETSADEAPGAAAAAVVE